jgi:hypothetical protein
MYVASVLSGYYICCNGYTHMLQTYVSIVSSGFSMFAAGSAPHEF